MCPPRGAIRRQPCALHAAAEWGGYKSARQMNVVDNIIHYGGEWPGQVGERSHTHGCARAPHLPLFPDAYPPTFPPSHKTLCTLEVVTNA
jgi:hypothetical protein